MKAKTTELWDTAPAPTKYSLPELCPLCGGKLRPAKVYVGIHPYIYADFTLKCWSDETHEFNFCFPYNPVMAMGYTVFDSAESKRYVTSRVCPFHNQTLKPIRLYGDLVFSDGTRKIQLRCPVCFYSERQTFKSGEEVKNK